MDPEKEDVFSDPEQTSDPDQDLVPDLDLDPHLDPDLDPDSEEEEEEDDIFNAWMQRCRGDLIRTSTTEEEPEQEVMERPGSRLERTGSRAERTGSKNSLEPPRRTDRRASLPCPAALSSMTLSRLHVSSAAPVTAKLLLRRSSSRRLLPSPQEVPPLPPERERRGSLVPLHAPPTIPERERDTWESDPPPPPHAPPTAPPTDTPRDTPTDTPSNKPGMLERRGLFRRRNVMSLSDADSACLICHNDLKHGTGGTRVLQCTHTFHKECIEEYLWRKPQCPTCHVQVSLPQNLLWTSTLN